MICVFSKGTCNVVEKIPGRQAVWKMIPLHVASKVSKIISRGAKKTEPKSTTKTKKTVVKKTRDS